MSNEKLGIVIGDGKGVQYIFPDPAKAALAVVEEFIPTVMAITRTRESEALVGDFRDVTHHETGSDIADSTLVLGLKYGFFNETR